LNCDQICQTEGISPPTRGKGKSLRRPWSPSPWIVSASRWLRTVVRPC